MHKITVLPIYLSKMKTLIKKIWLISIISAFMFLFTTSVQAQEAVNSSTSSSQNDVPQVDWFNILPELEDEEISDIQNKTKEIGSSWWNVWKKYNETASASGFSTEKQIQSWIMNRWTLTNYITFVIKFISQLWIAIWALFIMYAWYKYMTSVFQWGKAPTSTITNAIIGIIIVIFSFAIMKTLTSIVWLS